MKNLLLFKGWTLLYCILICFISSQSFATRHTNIVNELPLSFIPDSHWLSPSISHMLGMTAQQMTITGTITHNNMPMTGVTITVKGKNTVAVSDENGKFTITANGTDTLIFEYLGFKTLTIPVNNKTNLTVALEEDVNDLKEVTVNAGYYKVKDSERTGSISKITAKDIEKQPVTNVLAAMQGRMAGVDIIQDTGMPGGSFSIKIRGQNSLRTDGNAPLYIIDGVPYASDAIGSLQTSTVMPSFTSPLSNINPQDIESLEILKDADATAIYGSRGANGVVLVTTKKGKAGKTAFSASYKAGQGHVTRFMDLMDTQQYVAMRRQAFANDGITVYPANAYDVNGRWDQDRYTDWQDVLFGGTSEITGLQASVSGGSVQTQYFVSGNYHSETSVFPGNFIYKKGNVHFNVNHRSDDNRFRLMLSGSYTSQKNDLPWTDLTLEALNLPPNAPALYDEFGNLNWEGSTFRNPLRNLEGKYGSKNGDLVSNADLSYELFNNLLLKSSFGFTDLRFNELRTAPSTMFDPAYGVTSSGSTVSVNNTNRQSWIVEPQLNWKNIFAKWALDALAGTTFQSQKSSRLIQNGSGFASNSLIENLAAATTHFVYANEQAEYKYHAVFARVNVNWDKKYILNLTGRRDGSSRFGAGNRFANFGAVGVAWLFSNEDWLKKHLSFMSLGKLRASYGTTGSDQIGDYQFLDTYSTSGVGYFGVTGLQPTRLYNPDFGWESNKKLELAIETGFFDDRVALTAAWYRNRSSNQLVGIPLPGTAGFASVQANLDATVENKGTEFTLRTMNIRKPNFSWSTSVNLTVPTNKLLSFPGLESSPYAGQYEIGESVYIKKLYQFERVNEQTGIYEFTDFNGDGLITATEDRKVIRDLSPQFYGGFQSALEYYGFQFDFLFQFVHQDNVNPSYFMASPGAAANVSAQAVNSWQQPGDQAAYQLYTTGRNTAAMDAYYKYTNSDHAVTDASYIRLKNVALSYELPQRWTKVMRCRLSLQAQNLLTFTKYKGADPEFSTAGFLPPLRVITTGLELNF